MRSRTGLWAAALLLALAAVAAGPAPRARAADDLAAWCSRVGLTPLDGPVSLKTGVSFKARIAGSTTFRQRFKDQDVRQGDLVVVTLLALLPGHRGWLQIVNLRSGNVILLKY
jgi:hypothetical protein